MVVLRGAACRAGNPLGAKLQTAELWERRAEDVQRATLEFAKTRKHASAVESKGAQCESERDGVGNSSGNDASVAKEDELDINTKLKLAKAAIERAFSGGQQASVDGTSIVQECPLHAAHAIITYRSGRRAARSQAGDSLEPDPSPAAAFRARPLNRSAGGAFGSHSRLASGARQL